MPHNTATPMATGFGAASREAQLAVIKDVSIGLSRFTANGTVRIPFRSHLATAAIGRGD
ncbi:MAG TPA: hypothetical protein VFL17_09550 [Anaerolineae bacterium]|nr:hypothetical protein [Anaerolineae bacterium]